MARNRKTAAQAQQNFVNRVQQSTGAYVAGVTAPGVDWATAATSQAAKERRNAGLQAAIANDSIDKGIQRVGNAKWQNNTRVKGAQNWAPQTVANANAYGASMALVEQDYAAADAAMAKAGDGSTFASRMARMQAWDHTLHNAARARKGLPAE